MHHRKKARKGAAQGTAEHDFEQLAVGNAAILLSTIFWGVNYPFTKALIPAWMSAGDLAFARVAGGCLLFWLASLFTKWQTITAGDMKRLFVGGAVGLFGCIYLFVVALKYGSPIDISIIMTLPPAYVILMEVLFRGRRPNILEYSGVVISFVGAAIVIMGGHHGDVEGSDFLLGDFIAALSALCFAIYLVVLSGPTARYRPLILLRWVFLFGTLPGLFLLPGFLKMPLLEADAVVPWLELGFIVFCPTFLSYLLVQPAQKDLGAMLVSLYQYLTPVVAAITAILMGLDRLCLVQVLAMLVIIAGMVMTNIGKKLLERQKRAAA